MEKHKISYKNNNFGISPPTWKEEFDLPDERLYFVVDIQDNFNYIIKKHETVTDNPPIRMYVNKIKMWLHSKFKQDTT